MVGVSAIAFDRSSTGDGLWALDSSGRVYVSGTATHYGDLPSLGIIPNGLVVASAPASTGMGYYMLGAEVGVFTFSNLEFLGSLGAAPPNTAIVAITAFSS